LIRFAHKQQILFIFLFTSNLLDWLYM